MEQAVNYEAPSPSKLVVEPEQLKPNQQLSMTVEPPLEKRARTEQPHDSDEKEEDQDAVNEDDAASNTMESTDKEGVASSQEETALLGGMGTHTYLEHEKAIVFFNNVYFYADDGRIFW